MSLTPVCMTRSYRADARRGFTLLELLVMLAILALVSAVAVVRLRQPYRVARLGDAVGRLATLDGQARAYTQRFAREARLVYDLDRNLAYVESGGAEHHECFRLVLGGGARLDRIRTADRQADQGEFALDLSAAGASSSYAIRLGTGDGPCRWTFWAGLTGQAVEMKTEDDVKSLFELLAGTDAD